MKDLSCLSKDLSRVVIVDNSPFSFLLQPLNGIPCVPFSARLPYDEQVGILSAFKDLTFLMPKNLINFIFLFVSAIWLVQLLDVVLPLIKNLSLQKDVRPVLYERFHMPEWFQMHGIPASALTV